MFKKKKNKSEDEIVSELTKSSGSEDWLKEYSTAGELAIDMFQTPHEIIVRAPVAGVHPDDLDIAIENGVLTISGQRKDVSEIKEEDYYSKECYWGAFERSVALPVEVDATKTRAEMPNGILTIHLPKLNRADGKQVKIKLTK